MNISDMIVTCGLTPVRNIELAIALTKTIIKGANEEPQAMPEERRAISSMNNVVSMLDCAHELLTDTISEARRLLELQKDATQDRYFLFDDKGNVTELDRAGAEATGAFTFDEEDAALQDTIPD